MDPHPGQQQAGLQHAVLLLQQEVNSLLKIKLNLLMYY